VSVIFYLVWAWYWEVDNYFWYYFGSFQNYYYFIPTNWL